MQHGSAKQVILVLAVVAWIAVAVAGAFYSAFVNNLEVTVACATMATCVTASLWVYLGLLELRQYHRTAADSAEAMRRRMDHLEVLLQKLSRKESTALSGRPAPQLDAVSQVRSPEDVADLSASSPVPNACLEASQKRADPSAEKKSASGARSNGHPNGSPRHSPKFVQAPAGKVSAAAIRDEFAAFVRDGDFEAALAAGDELARQFPDSRLAAEFHSLRPYLLHRIAELESSSTRSA